MMIVHRLTVFAIILFGITSPTLNAQIECTKADTLYIQYEAKYTFDSKQVFATYPEYISWLEAQDLKYEGFIRYSSSIVQELPIPSQPTKLSAILENGEWYLPGYYNRIINPVKFEEFFKNKELFLVKDGALLKIERISYQLQYPYRKQGRMIDRSIRDTLLIDRSEVGRLRLPDSIDEKNYLLPISTFGEFLYMTESNEVLLDTVHTPVNLWDLRRMFYKLQPGGISSMDLAFILQHYYIVLRDGTKFYRLHTVHSSH